MSLMAFFLILSSVLLHALWHFISKSQKPHFGFFLVFSFSIFLTMLPLLLLSGVQPWRMPLQLWVCVIGGGLFGMLGDVGFSYAYRYADISQAYPMARALPVLLTAVVTGVFGIGRELSAVALGGMGIIFVGCVIMPLPRWRQIRLASYCNKGMFGILLAAVATTGYTIVDGFGIRAMLEFTDGTHRIAGAGSYSCLRELVAFFSLALVSMLRRKERKLLNRDLLSRPQPYLAGVFAGIAYLLVLIAMGFVSNVSYVQAFRQMSLPIGVLLGVWILKERVNSQKILAVVLILAGLVMVSVGR